MVDVPRRTLPNDPTNPDHQNERLRNVVDGMTPRSGRGGSRWQAPVARRDIAQAGARGIGSRNVQAERHHIQGWSISDDATDTFTLDFLPSAKSWNLMLNGIRVHRSEFSISGQTVTITDPAGLFLGPSATFPCDLEIQYDYVAGVLAVPLDLSGPDSIVGSFEAEPSLNSPYSPTFPTHQAGDLIVIAGLSRNGMGSEPEDNDGWTLASSQTLTIDFTTGAFKVWHKVATSGSTPFTVSGSFGSHPFVAAVFRGGVVLDAADGTPGTGTTHTTADPGTVPPQWGVYVVGKSNTTLTIEDPPTAVEHRASVYSALALHVDEVGGFGPADSTGNSGQWRSCVLKLGGV